jgi:hypothetical protein
MMDNYRTRFIKLIRFSLLLEKKLSACGGFSSTHNIKQLGFSGLGAFGSRFNILVGGQERSPKTQPFHIPIRCV